MRKAIVLGLLAGLFASTGAFAHHVNDGLPIGTFAEGVLSGLAHPVLGLDHLVFILGAGLAAGALAIGLRMPFLFIVASIAGLSAHLARLDVPLAETAVALSIIALGLAVGSRGGLGQTVWIVLFVGAGLFHGYAYGESVVGAQLVPLSGYLVGLGFVQTALACMTYFAGRKLAEGVGHAVPEMRQLGALLAVIGIVFVVFSVRQIA
jgi:urease accessory protein